MPGRRGERLRRQAPRCRKAPVPGAGMDAEIESAYALASRKFDIELKLLIDAIYHLYHYDFRDYAQASLRRRLKGALVHFKCETLSQLQDRVLREPGLFNTLLDHHTAQ